MVSSFLTREFHISCPEDILLHVSECSEHLETLSAFLHFQNSSFVLLSSAIGYTSKVPSVGFNVYQNPSRISFQINCSFVDLDVPFVHVLPVPFVDIVLWADVNIALN